MLSPKQKKALFGASIESRPRYVRVPLQMVNSVRELNTDVNFARLVAQFEQTDDRLRSSTNEPIAHIRLDTSGVRGWADFYDRYCSAYRALNGSRIIRRNSEKNSPGRPTIATSPTRQAITSRLSRTCWVSDIPIHSWA